MAEHGAAEEAAVRARVRAQVEMRERTAEGTPHLDALRRSIAVQLHRLAPPELAQLTQLVTAPQAALMSRIRATVRDLALGREEGWSR